MLWARLQHIESCAGRTGYWVRDSNKFIFVQPFKNFQGELTGPIVTWADIPALVDIVSKNKILRTTKSRPTMNSFDLHVTQHPSTTVTI